MLTINEPILPAAAAGAAAAPRRAAFRQLPANGLLTVRIRTASFFRLHFLAPSGVSVAFCLPLGVFPPGSADVVLDCFVLCFAAVPWLAVG